MPQPILLAWRLDLVDRLETAADLVNNLSLAIPDRRIAFVPRLALVGSCLSQLAGFARDLRQDRMPRLLRIFTQAAGLLRDSLEEALAETEGAPAWAKEDLGIVIDELVNLLAEAEQLQSSSWWRRDPPRVSENPSQDPVPHPLAFVRVRGAA